MISAAEIQGAESTLKSLDADGNGTLSPDELRPPRPPGGPGGPPPGPGAP